MDHRSCHRSLYKRRSTFVRPIIQNVPHGKQTETAETEAILSQVAERLLPVLLTNL